MARRTRERGKRHSPEQIVQKLREADAILSAGCCSSLESASRRIIAGGINTAR